jgi:PAS domain S-box-containing protein
MTQISAPALPDFDAIGLIDSLADGIYITDTERKILLWNRAAERITGWPADDVVGRTCSDNILCHVDKDGHELCGQEHCPLHRSVVTGRPSEAPMLVYAQSKSGRRVPVEVTVAPLRDRDGKAVGGIEVFRDASLGVHDMLRAKSIQEYSFTFEGTDDPRFDIEVCEEAHDLVGGDFYRVEQLDDDHLAIFVADVMGHGVPAALYTMHLASLWDHHRDEFSSPARFLGVINQRLHLVAADAGFFATAVFARYHPDTGALLISRAGHPAPLVFTNDGKVEELGTARPALGMLPDMQYEEHLCRIDPNETVLFFTDGAFEISDSEGNEMGIDGLQTMVRELMSGDGSFRIDALEERLLLFSNELQFPDDLTLLKLRRC